MRAHVRSAVVSVAVVAVLTLAGCAGGGAGSTGVSTSTPGAIQVDEGLVTVDLTIARSLLDPEGALSDDEIVTSASEKGITARVEGESVVYTMSKAQRDAMLAEARASAQKAVDELIADDTNSITAVEYDDAMTKFRVSVDAARYTQFESFYVLAFYMQGALYQQFSGVAPDDVDIAVEFVDQATGEVLDTGSYQEMRENFQQ